MGHPCTGTLRLSDGLIVEECNPSFIWSENSRYLAVPQWSRDLGFYLRQRVLVIDTRDRIVLASRRYLGWHQPESFNANILEIMELAPNSPTLSPCFRWRIPDDIATFKRLAYRW